MIYFQADLNEPAGRVSILGSRGVSIALDDPDLPPSLEHGKIFLQPGNSYEIKISSKKIKKLPAPYRSMCLREYPTDCQGVSGKYSSSICNSLCIAEVFRKECNCYEPHWHVGSLEEDYKAMNFCSPQCAKFIEWRRGYATGKYKMAKLTAEKCTTECESLRYTVFCP